MYRKYAVHSAFARRIAITFVFPLVAVVVCACGGRDILAAPQAPASSPMVASSLSNSLRGGSTLEISRQPTYAQGNDTSDDVCEGGFCIIQGQVYSFAANDGDSSCLNWSAANVPANVNVSFMPSKTCPPNSTTITIAPATSSTPGVLSFAIDVEATTGGPVAGSAFDGQVLCSNNAATCPHLELTDLNHGSIVISSPAPEQSTIVGQQINLVAKQTPNAKIGAFAISNISWVIPNDPLQSYNLANASTAAVPLPTPKGSQATYYWTWPGNWSGSPVEQNVTFSANLSRGSEVAQDTALVRFAVATPKIVALSYGGTQTMRVGPYRSQDPTQHLSFGGEESANDYGIIWDWSAVAPPGGGGYFAIMQLLKSTVNVESLPAPSPAPSGTVAPAPAPTYSSTKGAIKKDTCALYSDAIYAAAGATAEINAATAGNAHDAPGLVLDPPDYRSVATSQTFTTMLVYLPPGKLSRWVPIATQNWNWAGTAAWNGSSYMLDSGSVSNVAPAYPSLETPAYVGTWVAQPSPAPSCPKVPTPGA